MRRWLIFGFCIACGGSPSVDDDAGPRDSGGRDSAMPVRDAQTPADAGNDASASTGCEGALLCEDFESYALDGEPGGPWDVSMNRGAVAVDDTRAV